MSDGILHSKPPKPDLAISKEMLILICALLTIVISFSIAFRKKPAMASVKEDKSAATPSQALTFLPTTYADIPPVVEKARPLKIERNDDYLRKLLEEELKKRERAKTARLANLSFDGISSIELSNIEAKIEENNSTEKEENKKRSEVRLNQEVIEHPSPNTLMAGTLIPGVMLTGVNSDLPGRIIGQVSNDVFDTVSGRLKLIPMGTKVIGEYDNKIIFGQERVLIVWNRLIFPDGKSISLEGMSGADLAGQSGLSDRVDNHYGKLLTGVVLSTLLSTGAQLSEGRTFNNVNPSFSELATQGAARNINDVGQQITRRNLNIQPTLIISPGHRFNVFVHKDMVLENS